MLKHTTKHCLNMFKIDQTHTLANIARTCLKLIKLARTCSIPPHAFIIRFIVHVTFHSDLHVYESVPVLAHRARTRRCRTKTQQPMGHRPGGADIQQQAGVQAYMRNPNPESDAVQTSRQGEDDPV
jgi:hypothetical protein